MEQQKVSIWCCFVLFVWNSVRTSSSFIAGHPRLREYSYWELAFATCFFFRGLRLGSGAFGPVYKGCVADGRKVAIKRLNFENSDQGDKEFLTEIATISRLDHANVVSLYGYCIHQDERMLVYKYVPNKTLHHHLHGELNPQPLISTYASIWVMSVSDSNLTAYFLNFTYFRGWRGPNLAKQNEDCNSPGWSTFLPAW